MIARKPLGWGDVAGWAWGIGVCVFAVGFLLFAAAMAVLELHCEWRPDAQRCVVLAERAK